MINTKRALQICVAIGSLIPISAGLTGAIYGPSLTDDVLSISGDSHFRYLSGLLLAIGLGFWSTIPSIEAKSERFLVLTLIVVTGGISRVVGLFFGPWPHWPMLVGAVMEVGVTPLLCLWQARLAAFYGRPVGLG
jgi:hypothetical protein